MNILQFLFQWETSPLRTSVWNSTAKQHSRLTLKVTEAWNQKLQFPEWISCYCLPVTGEHKASCSNTYCGEQKLSTGAPQVGMLWFLFFIIYIWVMYLFFQLYAFWWDNTKTRLVLSLSHKETDEYSGVLTLRCCSYSIYLFFHYCRYGFTSPWINKYRHKIIMLFLIHAPSRGVCLWIKLYFMPCFSQGGVYF